jgi:hypothetical protein
LAFGLTAFFPAFALADFALAAATARARAAIISFDIFTGAGIVITK